MKDPISFEGLEMDGATAYIIIELLQTENYSIMLVKEPNAEIYHIKLIGGKFPKMENFASFTDEYAARIVADMIKNHIEEYPATMEINAPEE